ncbi:hypothetical protein RFI_33883, partial [Reticulomyxa filosa]
KDKHEDVRRSCARSLGIIAAKASEKRLEEVINALTSGSKDENNNVRVSCAKSIGVISEKLNEKQLENAIHTLIDGFKDKNNDVRQSCARSLGVISTNLNDKRLEEEQEYYYFDLYSKALKKISTKWNEKQSERVFNALIFVSKHSIDTKKDYYFVKLLGLISTKLNDKQLYLL